MWDAPWHWIVLAVIVIALFGYKKLPDASRALGRSLRIFKTEIKGMGEDDRAREDAGTTVAQAPAPAVPPASVVDAPTTATAPNGAGAPGTVATGSGGDGSAVNGSAVNGSAVNGNAPAAPAAAATPAGDGSRSTEK